MQNSSHRTYYTRKKQSCEHKMQQHKKEITMTHLMKADFQFYLFYIYSLFYSFAYFIFDTFNPPSLSNFEHAAAAKFSSSFR